jgi:predicted house-cleaning noncanonical NTP pyrophosphatase (MazG superfamily)
MENQEVARQVQRLRSLFGKVGNASNNDMSLQGHWAKYLCVMVAGLVENGLKEIFSEYIKDKSTKPIADYAISYITKLQNPKAEKVMDLVGSFKAEWRNELETFLANEGRKDAIDSIMNNRNQIAHGKDVGVTVVNVSNYFNKIVSVLEFIESQCK